MSTKVDVPISGYWILYNCCAWVCIFELTLHNIAGPSKKWKRKQGGSSLLTCNVTYSFLLAYYVLSWQWTLTRSNTQYTLKRTATLQSNTVFKHTVVFRERERGSALTILRCKRQHTHFVSYVRKPKPMCCYRCVPPTLVAEQWLSVSILPKACGTIHGTSQHLLDNLTTGKPIKHTIEHISSASWRATTTRIASSRSINSE